MQKMVTLGREGLSVPAIGLGCMGMSEFYGPSDEGQNVRVLDKALDLGCTFWDTADMYGPFTNEELLGRALKGRRDKVVLATKFGIARGDGGSFDGVKGGADYVGAACDASLKRLGTDYIDLYYQHRVDPDTPIEETVEAMASLVRAGKVRYIGLSEADPETIERANAVHPISALQTEYSIWSRDVERDILPTVRRLGIGFVAYSPLGRGFLAGGARRREDLSTGDWRLDNPRFAYSALTHNRVLAETVDLVAAELDATPAQVALSWVLSRGDDIAMIPGTRREARLAENWESQDLVLSPDQQARLSALIERGVAGSRY